MFCNYDTVHFIRQCYNFQAELVLIKMGLYWPNFSLVFLIHLFLYAGVYCMIDSIYADVEPSHVIFHAGTNNLPSHSVHSCLVYTKTVDSVFRAL